MYVRTLINTLCLTVALVSGASHAQTFPNRPVTIVVPYSAGGPVDNFTRALAKSLSERWHQPVIVQNKPGANEIIGADFVAKSAPDGYTLFAGTEASLTMGPNLYKKLPYHAETDFVPISHMVSLPLVFFVSKSVPVITMREFVDLAKNSTTKPLSYGSTGAGGIAHLPIVTLEKQEDIKMTHVPYKGAANLIPDVISGQVDSAVLGVSVIEQHIRNGSLKALAISSETRSAILPDVPTFKEAGLKDINAVFNIGLLAPHGVSPDLANKISADVRAVILDPDFRKKNIDAFSYVAVGSSPDEFKKFLATDFMLQADRIKTAHIILD